MDQLLAPPRNIMKILTCLLLSPLALLGTRLTTDYSADRTLRVARG